MPAIAHSAIESILDRPHGEHTSASRTCCLTATLDMLSMIVGYQRQIWAMCKIHFLLPIVPAWGLACQLLRKCWRVRYWRSTIFQACWNLFNTLKWLEPDESISESLFVLFKHCKIWQRRPRQALAEEKAIALLQAGEILDFEADCKDPRLRWTRTGKCAWYIMVYHIVNHVIAARNHINKLPCHRVPYSTLPYPTNKQICVWTIASIEIGRRSERYL